MNIRRFMLFFPENYPHRLAPSLNEQERKVCLAFGNFVPNAFWPGKSNGDASDPTWAHPACS